MPFIEPHRNTVALVPEPVDIGAIIAKKNEATLGMDAACDICLRPKDQTLDAREQKRIKAAIADVPANAVKFVMHSGICYIEAEDDRVLLNGERIAAAESLFDLDEISFGKPFDDTAVRLYFKARE